ncbi:hypothetical protein [Maritalea sp. S77]|uniref:hypothetical protein n=1 Tax=Maritalea sp. S77 TaxID=3415125 RepID=UPI003C7DA4AD
MGDPTIYYPPDCRNSPKNQLMVEFCLFLLGAGHSSLGDIIDDDAIWQQNVDHMIKGHADIISTIKSRDVAQNVEIFNVATHGNVGFVDGVCQTETSRFGFCFKVIFKSAAAKRVSKIVSY